MADKIELDTGLKILNLIYSLPEKQDVENLLCWNILDKTPKDLMPL